eukprot:Nk52_evm10s2622 gene=Nk52_evmTU10s2622
MSGNYNPRVAIVGGSKCGKTQLVSRLFDEAFCSKHKKTLGIKCFVKNYFLKNRPISLQVYDTEGLHMDETKGKRVLKEKHNNIVDSSEEGKACADEGKTEKKKCIGGQRASGAQIRHEVKRDGGKKERRKSSSAATTAKKQEVYTGSSASLVQRMSATELQDYHRMNFPSDFFQLNAPSRQGYEDGSSTLEQDSRDQSLASVVPSHKNASNLLVSSFAQGKNCGDKGMKLSNGNPPVNNQKSVAPRKRHSMINGIFDNSIVQEHENHVMNLINEISASSDAVVFVVDVTRRKSVDLLLSWYPEFLKICYRHCRNSMTEEGQIIGKKPKLFVLMNKCDKIPFDDKYKSVASIDGGVLSLKDLCVLNIVKTSFPFSKSALPENLREFLQEARNRPLLVSEAARYWCERKGIDWFDTSAKIEDNVPDIFDDILLETVSGLKDLKDFKHSLFQSTDEIAKLPAV